MSCFSDQQLNNGIKRVEFQFYYARFEKYAIIVESTTQDLKIMP